jgi:putative hemolysin
MSIVIVAFCLLLNAMISCIEMAFVSVTISQLKKLEKEGNLSAKKILKLRLNPERTLSVLQIGITLVGAISAAVSGAGAEEKISPWIQKTYNINESLSEFISVLIVVLPLTYLTVVIGELVPKSFALRYSTQISLFSSRILEIGDKILSPAVSIMEISTKLILNTFSKKRITDHSDSLEEGITVSDENKNYIINISNLEKKKIKDIMVILDKVEFIDSNLTFAEVMKIILESGHTRLPVIDNGIVLGFLHTKQFLSSYYLHGNAQWLKCVAKILEVNEEANPIEVLRTLQKNQNHMALVKNSELKELGIITLEDILEFIFGEIGDEDDGTVKLRNSKSIRTFARV